MALARHHHRGRNVWVSDAFPPRRNHERTGRLLEPTFRSGGVVPWLEPAEGHGPEPNLTGCSGRQGEAGTKLARPLAIPDSALRRTSAWANTYLARDHLTRPVPAGTFRPAVES
jgi:hypothetical protein